MGIRDRAVAEMQKAKYPHETIDAILEALNIFLGFYDSGGSVWAVSSYLNSLSPESLSDVKDPDILKVLTPIIRHANDPVKTCEYIKVLNALLDFRPLTPLTGEESEWMEVGKNMYQNTRCASVFRNTLFPKEKQCYDLDHPYGRDFPIKFPYYRDGLLLKSPVVTFGESAKR
jgi:hypothetical protein